MLKFPKFRPFGLRRTRSSADKGGRRLAGWTAAIAAITLVGGVLQTSSATSLSQELVKGTTTTEVSSSSTQDPVSFEYSSVVGESVTYTAKVSEGVPPIAGSGAAPSGLVDFTDAVSGNICTDVPLDDPNDATDETTEAECTVSPAYADPAEHTITATYEGNAEYIGSDDSLTQTVEKADSAVDVDSSTNPSVSGQAVVYVATVSVVSPGVATPSGKVSFSEDDVNGDPQPIPECSGTTNGKDLSFNDVTGKYEATCSPTTATYLSVGTHDISASYEGNEDLNGSLSPEPPLSQTIDPAMTETGVSSPGAVKTGEPVTYTAVVTVVVPGTGTPTGTVTFKEDGTEICAVALSTSGTTAGTATCPKTYDSAGNRSITAVYSGDSSFEGSESGAWTQVVNLPYGLLAQTNRSTDPTNASFRISGPRLGNYRLCVKYLAFDGVKDDVNDWPAVTPPPIAANTGIHRFGINFNNKCKTFSWASGANSDTENLLDAPLGSDDFGFATRGTYQVSWYMTNGVLVGTDTFVWNSWCPPSAGGFRQIGTWRTSRHKVRDSCYSDAANAGGRDSHFDKDRSLSWKGWHPEFVARDWVSSYGAPSVGAIGASGNGWGNGWRRLTGVWVCDRYHHGKSEVHPIFVAEERTASGDIKRYIGGAQYSTKTPSISGTWRTYKC